MVKAWHMLWNRSVQTFFSFSAVIALWNTIKKERRPVLHVVPCLVTCVAFLLCQKDNIYWRDLPGVVESFKSEALSCSIMSISNQHSINTFWKWMSVLYIIGYYLHSHSFFYMLIYLFVNKPYQISLNTNHSSGCSFWSDTSPLRFSIWCNCPQNCKCSHFPNNPGSWKYTAGHIALPAALPAAFGHWPILTSELQWKKPGLVKQCCHC